MEGIEEETKNEKKLCAHGLEEIYRYNAIPIKMSMAYFPELEQIILIFL